MINVKSITGCLVIKGSGMTSLKAFSNLEVVKYDKDLCPGSFINFEKYTILNSAYIAAVLISDNTLLRYLGMQKLKKVQKLNNSNLFF